MKIQHVLKLATLTALLAVSSAQAQTSDSTWLPWTSAPATTFTPSARVNTYVQQGSAAGQPNARAYAGCGGNKMIAGGGTCTDYYGLTAVAESQPWGNGWIVGCSSANGRTAYAIASAVCSY